MNLLEDEGWIECAARWRSPPSDFQRRRKRIAGEHLGASLYELLPGEKTFPYHYELGNDELLVVVTGHPTVRDSDGEHEVHPGDCILFPSGPAGAHQIINRSREPVRVLLVSNFAMPRGAVQVDSDKLMIRWGPEPEDSLWFRREDAVDYWEGE